MSGPGRQRTSDLTVHISRRALRRVLVGIVLALGVASFFVQLLKFPLNVSSAYGIVPLLDGDAEGNIPTFYSSLALVACAALLGVRAVAARQAAEQYARHWMLLAAIFFLAALDESAQFHERVNHYIASAAGVSDQALPWVAPAAALVLALALAYRGFARDLAGPVQRRAMLGGALLVAGALGLELLEAASSTLNGETAELADGLVSTVQEFLEMLGVVYILDALVLEVSLGGSVHLWFADRPADAAELSSRDVGEPD
jgi:hypothetical protein